MTQSGAALLAIAEGIKTRHAPGTNHCIYGGSVEHGWAKHSASQPCPDILAARRLIKIVTQGDSDV